MDTKYNKCSKLDKESLIYTLELWNLTNNNKYKRSTLYSANIPILSCLKYKEIEEFPDYDYINSITYEMLIRTDKYKHIVELKSDEQKRKEYKKLGFTEDDFYGLNKEILPKSSSYAIFNLQNSLEINCIDNGLDKLIKFYLDNNLLFKIANNDTCVKQTFWSSINKKYSAITNISLQDIKSSIGDYYIPIKQDKSENHWDFSSKHTQRYISLQKKIFLYMLDDAFLLEIEGNIPNDTVTKVKIHYTRPHIKLKESAVFEIPIDFQWSKEDIIKLVSEMKDSIDKNEIKPVYHYVYNKIFETLKIDKKSEFKVTKKSIAEAFYIYDLYIELKLQYEKNNSYARAKIDEKFRKKRIKVKQEYSKLFFNEYNLLENIKDKDKKNKRLVIFKKEVSKLKKKLKKEIEKLHKEKNRQYREKTKQYNWKDILTLIACEQGITEYKCNRYLTFMKKFIENYEYTKLIGSFS